MRVVILADIHSNLEALRTVLQDAEDRGGFEEVWCLGDTVGYGPDPGACIELLRQLKAFGVAGNHDLAAVGKLSTQDFNANARFSARWTASKLTPEDAQYLAALPHVVRRNGLHPGPLQPQEPGS